MSNFFKNWSNGAKCATVAGTLFSALILAGFPGVLYLVGQSLLLMGAVLAVFGLICAVVYLEERYEDKLKWLSNVLLGVSAVTVIGGFTYLSSFVTSVAFKALKGLPVDQHGTIIPLKGWLALAFVGVVVLATICIYKHGLKPNIKEDSGKSLKALVAAVTLITALALFSVPGSFVYLSYHIQNPAVERQRISKQIGKLHEQIDEQKKALESFSK